MSKSFDMTTNTETLSERDSSREERSNPPSENELSSSISSVVPLIDNEASAFPTIQAATAAASSASTRRASKSPSTDKALRRSNRKEYPPSFWYDMCEKFSSYPEKYNQSQTEFLRHADSGVLSFNDRQSFGNRLRAYKQGTLRRDDSVLRERKGKYLDVEKCLLAFLETRDQFADKGKMAVSWPFLLEMAKRFAVALGHPPGEFSGSPGWLANVLKRHKTKIDFDVSDTDALLYLENIKRYCKKRKLGKEIRNMSVELQNLVEQKLGERKSDNGKDDGHDERLERPLEQRNSLVEEFQDRKSNQFGVHPPDEVPTNADNRSIPSGMATFSEFWTTQQDDI